MLFHSQAFVLAFLPVTVALYYRLAGNVHAREWLLIAASFAFYGWWDARFLPLLLGQAAGSWLIAECHHARPSRGWLIAGIAFNLGVLGLFKYADFAVTVVEQAGGVSLPRAGLILPIGISFYTFQIISYLADLTRGGAPRYGPRRFVLFVVLFPQLIAGPIVRHNEIMPQFDLDPWRPGVAERVGRGLLLFVIGFVEKFFIADRLATIADPVFANAVQATPVLTDAWAGALAFSLQIYFDFLAYSDMAIGIGMMLGLALPMNFNVPYRATNIREFWRRWHMTLSRFLRDYVYIPLGGSREGPARYVWATMVTMGLCGLWHGAGWTFVLWGLGHGMGLMACHAWQAGGGRLPAPLGWLTTLLFVVLLFVLFRAPDLVSAGHMFAGLAGLAGRGTMWAVETQVMILIAGALALFKVPTVEIALRWAPPSRAAAAALAATALVCVLEVGKDQPQSFIYFQF